MDIKVKGKIHNKYKIEVKNINTGEIEQTGYAENIILDNMFTSSEFANYEDSTIGKAIAFGEGNGVIASTRTALFNPRGVKDVIEVELSINQVPATSYRTTKIILSPEEYIGAEITEVGLTSHTASAIIYTHALIRDSEGELLTLQPKSSLQEITIYSTVYFSLDVPPGITLVNLPNNTITNAGLLMNSRLLTGTTTSSHINAVYINNTDITVVNGQQVDFVNELDNTFSKYRRVGTTQGNEKIKSLQFRASLNSGFAQNTFNIDLETLAENSDVMWGGHELKNILIDTGDGNTLEFNIFWDEVWLIKPKKVYINGVEVTSGVTWSANTITFDTAPSATLNITADYWVKYIPKDINHIVDINLLLTFGEGTPI